MAAAAAGADSTGPGGGPERLSARISRCSSHRPAPYQPHPPGRLVREGRALTRAGPFPRGLSPAARPLPALSSPLQPATVPGRPPRRARAGAAPLPAAGSRRHCLPGRQPSDACALLDDQAKAAGQPNWTACHLDNVWPLALLCVLTQLMWGADPAQRVPIGSHGKHGEGQPRHVGAGGEEASGWVGVLAPLVSWRAG